MQMRKIYRDDLTVWQIHHLLLEKRRLARHSQLDHFHRTGRVVPLVGETDSFDFTGKSISSAGTVRREKKPHTWLDHVLLVMEIRAFNGLVAVVFTGLSTLGSLNRVFAAGLQPPAIAPTPLVQAVVLPDGHTPPDAAGKSRPNEAEIPEHLRPLWRSIVNLPTPLPGR